jgi:hypothetical protein
VLAAALDSKACPSQAAASRIHTTEPQVLASELPTEVRAGWER